MRNDIRSGKEDINIIRRDGADTEIRCEGPDPWQQRFSISARTNFLHDLDMFSLPIANELQKISTDINKKN